MDTDVPRCVPVLDEEAGEYFCSVCDWGHGKGVKAPFSRACRGREGEQERQAAREAREASTAPRRAPRGPGTELTKLFAWFGFRHTPSCACARHARQMDKWGPDGCEENIEEVLDWLDEEAKKRTVTRVIATPGGAATMEDTMPFSRPVAEQIVRLAIRRARRKETRSQES